MRRLFGFLIAVALCVPVGASAWWQSIQQIGVSAGGGGGYTGPGDVVSGAVAWWGLRGYNGAYATGANPAIDVCDDSTLITCSTINILANGTLDVATAAASAACATKCDITKWYDQTGNGHHVTASAKTQMVTLTFSCVGSLPCGLFNSTGAAYISGGSVVANIPNSTSAVFNRTTNVTTFQSVVNFNDGNTWLGTSNSANTSRIAGSVAANTSTMSDNAWHAVQGVYASGTASVISVDNTETTGVNIGAANENSPVCFMGSSGASCGNNPFTGKIAEGGVWNAAFTGTQRTNMCHNQFAFWGTATSC